MHVFGLTGGIASGKSTVASRLKARGVPVVDADALAREIVQPGAPALEEIAAEFGPTVLTPEGTLDRKEVARIAFSDEAKRRRLNAITHPRIWELAAVRFAEIKEKGEPLACWEAALIVENGMADQFRPLVVVSAPEMLQLTRLRSRDGAAQEDALARIRAQKPLADKVAVADFVIDTSGSLEDNARQTDDVLGAICKHLEIDPARYPMVELRLETRRS